MTEIELGLGKVFLSKNVQNMCYPWHYMITFCTPCEERKINGIAVCLLVLIVPNEAQKFSTLKYSGEWLEVR
jgi:hypothetical protein